MVGIAGGVGGLHILTLARLGVGGFNIADPDTFEAVNISRQFGASINTFGKNKAEVIFQMVKDINPQANVTVFNEGVNENNIYAFLNNADVFVDGIAFFEINTRRLIFLLMVTGLVGAVLLKKIYRNRAFI